MTKTNQAFLAWSWISDEGNININEIAFLHSRGIIQLKTLSGWHDQDCLQMVGFVHNPVPGVLFYSYIQAYGSFPFLLISSLSWFYFYQHINPSNTDDSLSYNYKLSLRQAPWGVTYAHWLPR